MTNPKKTGPDSQAGQAPEQETWDERIERVRNEVWPGEHESKTPEQGGPEMNSECGYCSPFGHEPTCPNITKAAPSPEKAGAEPMSALQYAQDWFGWGEDKHGAVILHLHGPKIEVTYENLDAIRKALAWMMNDYAAHSTQALREERDNLIHDRDGTLELVRLNALTRDLQEQAIKSLQGRIAELEQALGERKP